MPLPDLNEMTPFISTYLHIAWTVGPTDRQMSAPQNATPMPCCLLAESTVPLEQGEGKGGAVSVLTSSLVTGTSERMEKCLAGHP